MGVLRLLLAITVVIAHSTSIFGLTFVGGEVAVQTFYVISGFYMAMVLTEKYYNKSYKLFITNRLLRLYPIYWTILGVSILLSLLSFFLVGENSSDKINAIVNAQSTLHHPFFVIAWAAFANIFLFFQDWFIFIGIDNGGLTFLKDFHNSPFPLYKLIYIPQAWTIGVEISFYLIAPFLIKKSNKVLISILLLSLSIRLLLYINGMKYDPWTHRFFPNEIAFFIMGMLTYRLLYKSKLENKYLQVFRSYSLIIAILMTVVYQFINHDIYKYFYILTIAFLVPFIFEKYKNNKFDNFIGELSYPIYISHITLYIILQQVSSTVAFSNGLTLILVSIIFSIFLNKFITTPIEKIRLKRAK